MQLALTAVLVIGFQHTSPAPSTTYLQLKAIQYPVGAQRRAELAYPKPRYDFIAGDKLPAGQRCFQRLGRQGAGCGS